MKQEELDFLAEQIHVRTAESLLAKLNDPEVSAAELKVALDFLKHNNITVTKGHMDALKEAAETSVHGPNVYPFPTPPAEAVEEEINHG